MPRVRLCVLWQRCALRRAEGLGGEICHAAGDMRAERAEMGYTGVERGYIETKKTTSYPSRRKPLFPIRWDDAPGILLFLI